MQCFRDRHRVRAVLPSFGGRPAGCSSGRGLLRDSGHPNGLTAIVAEHPDTSPAHQCNTTVGSALPGSFQTGNVAVTSVNPGREPEGRRDRSSKEDNGPVPDVLR